MPNIYQWIVFVCTAVLIFLEIIFFYHPYKQIQTILLVGLTTVVGFFLYRVTGKIEKSERYKSINDRPVKLDTPTDIEAYRKQATIWIFASVIVLIFGTIIIRMIEPGFYGFQTILSIAVMAHGMGYYAMSKGYSRVLGLALGLLSWIGLIILFCMKDRSVYGSDS